MEFMSKIRWILVVAVFVIALILVSWGLLSIARNMFKGKDTNTTLVDSSVDFLVESTKVAEYSVQGPVVANENQRSYAISVSENVVTMKTYKSYGQTLLQEKSYPNTTDSYKTFLSALGNSNITAIKKNSSASTDSDPTFADKGVCATGRKYMVELDSSMRRWSTSCDSKQGNAGFVMGRVANLFQKQVPDFGTLSNGLGI